jgi:hypothetical protein
MCGRTHFLHQWRLMWLAEDICREQPDPVTNRTEFRCSNRTVDVFDSSFAMPHSKDATYECPQAKFLKSTRCSEFYILNILGHWLLRNLAQLLKSTRCSEFDIVHILGHWLLRIFATEYLQVAWWPMPGVSNTENQQDRGFEWGGVFPMPAHSGSKNAAVEVHVSAVRRSSLQSMPRKYSQQSRSTGFGWLCP